MPKNEEPTKPPESDPLVSKLLESRNVIISQEITDESTQRVVTQLLLLEAADASKEIRIFINSPGGSADGGFAIFDMIRFIKPPVKTIAVGLVASAATIVLLGAKKDCRLALPHSRFLIHQPSTQFYGPAADIEINAQEMLKLREKANQLIAGETGQTVQKVAADTHRDYWMGPDEAKKYGLIHKVIRTRDEI